MQKKKLLAIGEAARYLNVSRDTLRRWEKKGKLKTLRSPSNRRFYTQDQLDALISSPEKAKKRPLIKKKIGFKPRLKLPSLKFKLEPQIIIFGLIGFFTAALLIFLVQSLF